MKRRNESGGYVGGIDEAGRGPLAGPVVAGIVVLHPGQVISGLRDSKQLSAKRRNELSGQIKISAKAWGIGVATAAEIDDLNILQATLLAMARAFERIDLELDCVYVDGNVSPMLPVRTHPIVKGDQKIPQISAASVIAKVERDAFMVDLDERFHVYGFAQHKGYPTHSHLLALSEFGPCVEHRRSFAPVRNVLRARMSKVR